MGEAQAEQHEDELHTKFLPGSGGGADKRHGSSASEVGTDDRTAKRKRKMKMKMSYTQNYLTGLQISSCRRHWQAFPLSRRVATSFTRTTISHSWVTRDPHSSVFYTSQKRMHRYVKIIISKWLGKVLIYSPSTDLLRPMQSHSDTHKQVWTKLFLQLHQP